MHENKIIYLLAMSVLKVGGKFVTPMLIGLPTDDAFVGVDGLLWLDLQHNVKSLKHFKCSQQLKALFRLVAGCCRLTLYSALNDHGLFTNVNTDRRHRIEKTFLSTKLTRLDFQIN